MTDIYNKHLQNAILRAEQRGRGKETAKVSWYDIEKDLKRSRSSQIGCGYLLTACIVVLVVLVAVLHG